MKRRGTLKGLGREIVIRLKWYGTLWLDRPWLAVSHNFFNCAYDFMLN
jgi:hypothetical protein